jgi:acyl carrier protein
MQEADGLAAEIKALIIDALALEDVAPEDIETEAPLFVEGLGLDSIDALELAMVLEERYGVKLGEDPDENERIFGSVASLMTFVTENRAPAGVAAERASSGEDVFEILRRIILADFDLPPAAVVPQAHFADDLDLDSLDAVDLLHKVEDETGVHLELDQLKDVERLEDLVALIQRTPVAESAV